MQVALPELLSVLAHELRSPLAVIQGYIRLLQRQRPASDPDVAMLTAMLDATSRLTEIGRHASDLSLFLKHPPSDPPAYISVRDLLGHVANDAAGITMAAHFDNGDNRSIRTSDGTLLARAIMSLAHLAMRESGQRSLTVQASQESTHLRLALLPNVRAGAEPDPVTASESTDPEPVDFDRGGLGLGLILASYVLESHRAQATFTNGTGQINLLVPTEERAS